MLAFYSADDIATVRWRSRGCTATGPPSANLSSARASDSGRAHGDDVGCRAGRRCQLNFVIDSSLPDRIAVATASKIATSCAACWLVYGGRSERSYAVRIFSHLPAAFC